MPFIKAVIIWGDELGTDDLATLAIVLLTTTIASKVRSGIEPPESSPAIIESPGPVVAHTPSTAEAAAMAATVTAAVSDNLA